MARQTIVHKALSELDDEKSGRFSPIPWWRVAGDGQALPVRNTVSLNFVDVHNLTAAGAGLPLHLQAPM